MKPLTPVENSNELIAKLKDHFEGELHTDETTRLLYATDASEYRELPMAVAYPKSESDIIALVELAKNIGTTLIPRTAGTSLAGQVVGNGLVIDMSRHLNGIIDFNKDEQWVKVQPGVIRDELNQWLKPHGLFFSPETSTSNRCMIGGMVGNNACGAHSLIYGSTRDHLLSVRAVLSDATLAEFKPLNAAEFEKKCELSSLEGKIYRTTRDLLSNAENQLSIRNEYPDPELKRRNTGYSLDLLLDSEPFNSQAPAFNMCKLLAGSEGTLAIATEITLHLDQLPPKNIGVVCVHFTTLEQALLGNLIALKYRPGAIELIDEVILSCTKDNLEQNRNRFFIEGNPGAIIVVEFARDSKEEIIKLSQDMEAEMRSAGLGYHFPLLFDGDVNKVWALRKAGLGLLSNIPGDAKPVSLIEDTAVKADALPGYIAEFKQMMERHHLSCVYHAHIATGELHIRPVLNLKDKQDVALFRSIALETAHLVKKYRGSLSGEHGDGRLRGEFIPVIVGQHNYQLMRQIKAAWDASGIFNKGKIVDTPPMDKGFRFEPGQPVSEFDTLFDYDKVMGFMRQIEKCNGSGDCRKTHLMGGTMCPSYMASHDEKDTPRARANIMRELFYRDGEKAFESDQIYQLLDLCLSCKACKSECPSGIDVAKLKAEFLQKYYDKKGAPLRSKLIAHISSVNQLGMVWPKAFNFLANNKLSAITIKSALGFAPQRSIPPLSDKTFRNWLKKNLHDLNQTLPNSAKNVYLFADEFTQYNDVHIGVTTVKLLNSLGYKVLIPTHKASGRTFLSKGFLRKAKKIAQFNVEKLEPVISADAPLLGIEPSTILSFRDEYPDLVGVALKAKAEKLAKDVWMIDEFLASEMDKGIIKREWFTKTERKIKLHGHCQQKAVASTIATKRILGFPENYQVEEIASGCCGMAGSFGYEKEHYKFSMNVGELVLFPAVRSANSDVTIVAPGTSCRHQIFDGTGRKALHPVEVLAQALI